MKGLWILCFHFCTIIITDSLPLLRQEPNLFIVLIHSMVPMPKTRNDVYAFIFATLPGSRMTIFFFVRWSPSTVTGSYLPFNCCRKRSSNSPCSNFPRNWEMRNTPNHVFLRFSGLTEENDYRRPWKALLEPNTPESFSRLPFDQELVLVLPRRAPNVKRLWILSKNRDQLVTGSRPNTFKSVAASPSFSLAQFPRTWTMDLASGKSQINVVATLYALHFRRHLLPKVGHLTY